MGHLDNYFRATVDSGNGQRSAVWGYSRFRTTIGRLDNGDYFRTIGHLDNGRLFRTTVDYLERRSGNGESSVFWSLLAFHLNYTDFGRLGNLDTPVYHPQ